MNRLTREWVDIAAGEFAAATREAAVTEQPFPSGVCFHSQQCVEKLMKAVLIQSGTRFDKTHNLRLLAALIHTSHPTAPMPDDPDLDLLQPGAVEYRYPGDQPDMDDARVVLDACRRVRTILLAMLEGSAKM